MEIRLQISTNSKLYLKDPEQSQLGRNIIQDSIVMIHNIGFEEFTFKKLAAKIGTTEASIYRYFENKHRLLIYITTWFWTWLEYQIIFHTNNIKDAKQKIIAIIKLVTFNIKDEFQWKHVDKEMLYQIVISESNKAYLTKHVSEDNKKQFFKPYKDLCARIADFFSAYNPNYPYPRSLSSTVLEMAHLQFFFKENLPSLTDTGNAKNKDNNMVFLYLKDLVFAALD